MERKNAIGYNEATYGSMDRNVWCMESPAAVTPAGLMEEIPLRQDNKDMTVLQHTQVVCLLAKWSRRAQNAGFSGCDVEIFFFKAQP